MAGDEDGGAPRLDGGATRSRWPEAEQLGHLLEQLLALVPDDVRLRLTEAARELLEALRALIDWCVERLERNAAGGSVERRDIPIL